MRKQVPKTKNANLFRPFGRKRLTLSAASAAMDSYPAAVAPIPKLREANVGVRPAVVTSAALVLSQVDDDPGIGACVREFPREARSQPFHVPHELVEVGLHRVSA